MLSVFFCLLLRIWLTKSFCIVLPTAMTGLVTRSFRAYGWVCAQKPYELMFLVITATMAMMTMTGETHLAPVAEHSGGGGVDRVVMAALRCGATLYTYHQIRLLHRQGSPHILGKQRTACTGSTYQVITHPCM